MDEDAAREAHHRKLERLYHGAPITRSQGARLRVDDGEAEVRLAVREDLLHAAGALHGSLYFRVLDDAAFFAANSRLDDALVLTASFSVDFLRPVSGGEIVARGQVVERTGRRFHCRAEARDDDGARVALGTGTFVVSDIPLDVDVGYA